MKVVLAHDSKGRVRVRVSRVRPDSAVPFTNHNAVTLNNASDLRGYPLSDHYWAITGTINLCGVMSHLGSSLALWII